MLGSAFTSEVVADSRPALRPHTDRESVQPFLFLELELNPLPDFRTGLKGP